MRSIILAIAFAALPLSAARADVASAAPSGFMLQAEAASTASPDQAWRALTRIDRWWNDTHTYSGDARRLSLDPRAGGCWCERWEGNSVEHARVLTVFNHQGVRTLRLEGALGPLQEMGVSAILTFTVRPDSQTGSVIAMTYRVSGDPSLDLAAIAPPVDAVLMEQFSRLIRFSSHGSPN